jgi:hypothetical protein
MYIVADILSKHISKGYDLVINNDISVISNKEKEYSTYICTILDIQ